jgi:hypothetical protein
MRRILILFLLVLFLASCGSRPVDPAGVYILNYNSARYTLTIEAIGKYSLRTRSVGKATINIEGTWEAEDQDNRVLSFSGIIWHDFQANPGNGFWRAAFEGSGDQKICMDGEGTACFLKQVK